MPQKKLRKGTKGKRGLPACDPMILKNGIPIARLATKTPPAKAEQWVNVLVRNTKLRLDWYLKEGQPTILHLGDDASRLLALQYIAAYQGVFGVRVVYLHLKKN